MNLGISVTGPTKKMEHLKKYIANTLLGLFLFCAFSCEISEETKMQKCCFKDENSKSMVECRTNDLWRATRSIAEDFNSIEIVRIIGLEPDQAESDSQNINGIISPVICKADSLKQLILQLQGEIDFPKCIYNSKSLWYLDISHNPGIDLSQIYRFKNLSHLTINDCSLGDSNVDLNELKNWKDLQVLGLEMNGFSMIIQDSIKKILPKTKVYF